MRSTLLLAICLLFFSCNKDGDVVDVAFKTWCNDCDVKYSIAGKDLANEHLVMSGSTMHTLHAPVRRGEEVTMHCTYRGVTDTASAIAISVDDEQEAFAYARYDTAIQLLVVIPEAER